MINSCLVGNFAFSGGGHIGLVAKHPSQERRPGFDPCFFHGGFSRLSHDGDLNIGPQVVTLPGAWCYRVSAGTGWPSISILWLGEIASLMSSFCLCLSM